MKAGQNMQRLMYLKAVKKTNNISSTFFMINLHVPEFDKLRLTKRALKNPFNFSKIQYCSRENWILMHAIITTEVKPLNFIKKSGPF